MSYFAKQIVVVSVVLLWGVLPLNAQHKQCMRLVWWNVENFFDPSNDSLKNDDDFTFDGSYKWSYKRFDSKKNNIYKVVSSMGIDTVPIMVGLCEVENSWVLTQMCRNTPLRQYNYNFVHFDSPDKRGIDVALLYPANAFNVLYSKPIPVVDSLDASFATRDVLLVSGTVFGGDTLFLLLNHFPSKRGGAESEKRRILAAEVLKYTIDTIVQKHPDAMVVAMGDFNATPSDCCIVNTLNVSPRRKDWEQNTLINLMSDLEVGEGTYKYQGCWSVIDQIMISKNLHPLWSAKCEVEAGKANIYKPDFLLQPDKKYLGNKPIPTYSGPIYKNGYSDHLPVYIDIMTTSKH